MRLASTDNRRSKARRAPDDAFIHIRGEEQTGRRSGSTIACLIPDAFVTTRAPPGTRVPTRFPNETALPCTKPREADTSPRPPLSRRHPRFMRVRANLCVLRETCMAPASPPTACNMWDRTQRTWRARRSRPVRPAIHHRKKFRSLSSPRLSSWIYTSRGCVRARP